jgi:MOSC domain-containing protein YiiM
VKVVSLNTGRPRELQVNGETVRTSIWKQPRAGRLQVTTLNIDGDAQSDLSVHGGPFKAVYCYPAEHYTYWRQQLPDADLPWGVFGENLTTEGVLEDRISIGDRFRVGTAEFRITQPRQPCFKLALRFGREDIVRRFIEAGRSGFYVSVEREGALASGDPIELLDREADSMTIKEINALRYDARDQQRELQKAAGLSGLAPGWRDHFRRRMNEP